jgi:protein-tyrosine phosphatase
MFLSGASLADFIEDSRTAMHLIEPGLYLGSIEATKKHDFLNQHGITRVLSILDTFRYFPPLPSEVDHLKITLPDFPDSRIIDHFPEGLKFISDSQKSRRPILVHCAAGVSRSASMVIGYLMVKYNLNFESAKAMVREKRRCIWPNEGFERQLRNLDINQYKQYLD